MSFEDSKVLEFHQYHNSEKTSLIIYADFKSLTENTDGCIIILRNYLQLK